MAPLWEWPLPAKEFLWLFPPELFHGNTGSENARRQLAVIYGNVS